MQKQTLKIWDYATSRYKTTPTGRAKTVRVGSPEYNKLISQGYKRIGDSAIWNVPTIEEIRTVQRPLIEQYKRSSVPARPPVRVREQQEFTPLREALVKRRQEMKLLRPRITEVRKDAFRGFKRESYRLEDVGSQESLYNMFDQVRSGRHDTTAIVRFISPAGEPRYITMTPEKLDTFDDFTEYIDKISQGDVAGSDKLGEGDSLDTSYLATINFDIFGEGKISEPFFINADEEKNIDSLCLFRACFSQIQYDDKRQVPKDITDLTEMIRLLKELYDCDLICYCDYTDDLKSANNKYKKVKIGDRVMMLAEVEVNLRMLAAGETGCTNSISIAYYDQHFIKFTGIKSGQFYLDHTKKLLRVVDDKIVEERRRQQIVDRLKSDTIVNEIGFTTRVVTFDIETRYDESYVGLLRPYSISWTYANNGYFYFGDDCVEKMLSFLMERAENTLFCLLGYNSSRFDNIFLLPAMLRMDILTDVFYQKNSVLNIRWGGRHVVHDICRFTMSSLERAGREFKTLFQKIGGFNHESIQSHFNHTGNIGSYFHDIACAGQSHSIFEVKYIEEGYTNNTEKDYTLRQKLKEMIENRACDEDIDKLRAEILLSEEKLNRGKYVQPDALRTEIARLCPCKCVKYCNLITYNLFDVFSTEELYFGIEKVMKDNNAIGPGCRLFDNKTIGSIIYKLFTQDVSKRIKLPSMDLPTYKRVRSGLFAGRTQCYKGVSFDLSREHKYVMLDVKSLYPYVMLNRYFPAGKIINISYAACARKDLIGFYNCKISQAGLNKNVIPLRSPKAPLNWNYSGDITVFINTVDISCLIDAGARVEILKNSDGIDDGFAFSEKVRGDDLFRVLAMWKNIKEQQDILKAQGKPHNVVLRNMAKTFLNALSGKVIENIHLDATTLVRTASEMSRIISESKDVRKLQLNNILTPTAGLVTYTRDEEKEFKRQNRPIYLGTLIYAYARDHMYRSILANYDVIYQDTDSALMSSDEYKRFKSEMPDLLGEDFGKFALEDFSELFDSYITLSPKNYFIMGMRDGKYTVLKKGFKGVNLTRDKYIHNPADYCEHIGQTFKSNGTIYDVNNKTGFELYTGEIDYSGYNNMREMCGLPQITAPKTVYDDWQRFIDDIIKNSCAYVLTSSLNKTTRNIESSGACAGAIYQRYLLKKVKINLLGAAIPFAKPANEILLRLHSGRNSYESINVANDAVPICERKFWHKSQCKFENYIGYTDLGGEHGNRAYNFKNYDEYAKSDLILSLLNASGEDFYFNEYYMNEAIPTRLWIDIDLNISAERVKLIEEFIELVVEGGDNKILQSTNGKLHIVLNIPTSQPVQVFKKVKVGRKIELRATGELYHDSTPRGRKALLLFFKDRLQSLMGNDTYDEEWDRAFDMRAPGLRAPFSIKMTGGKCTARHYYKPIGLTQEDFSNEDKAKIIIDCSIYKHPRGQIRASYLQEIEIIASNVEKKLAHKSSHLLSVCKKYKIDAALRTILISGVKTVITQDFLDSCINKLSSQYVGAYWRSVIIRLANISTMFIFDPTYLLHKWSAQDVSYNCDGNNNAWSWAVKNAKKEDAETSLAWLVNKSQ